MTMTYKVLAAINFIVAGLLIEQALISPFITVLCLANIALGIFNLWNLK